MKGKVKISKSGVMHLNCRLILNYSSLSVTYFQVEPDDKMEDAKTYYHSTLFTAKKATYSIQTPYNIYLVYIVYNMMVDTRLALLPMQGLWSQTWCGGTFTREAVRGIAVRGIEV